MGVAEGVRARSRAWRRLLTGATAADLAVLGAVGVARGDEETLAYSGLVLLGLLLLRLRSGVAGAITLALLMLNAAAWMVPATVANIGGREELMDVLIPSSLAVLSLAASIAAVGAVVRRKVRTDGRPFRGDERESGGAARVVAQAAIVAFAIAVAAGIVQQRGDDGAAALAGDLRVGMRSASFSVETVRAPAGTVAVFVANEDLFWHTFTIDELDVDVGLSTGRERRVTFEAAPGRYEYYCAVPGHRQIGMKGTLEVT